MYWYKYVNALLTQCEIMDGKIKVHVLTSK